MLSCCPRPPPVCHLHPGPTGPVPRESGGPRRLVPTRSDGGGGRGTLTRGRSLRRRSGRRALRDLRLMVVKCRVTAGNPVRITNPTRGRLLFLLPPAPLCLGFCVPLVGGVGSVSPVPFAWFPLAPFRLAKVRVRPPGCLVGPSSFFFFPSLFLLFLVPFFFWMLDSPAPRACVAATPARPDSPTVGVQVAGWQRRGKRGGRPCSICC